MITDRVVMETRCPRCLAEPGDKCIDDQGNPAPGVLTHMARVTAWREQLQATWDGEQ